MKAAVRLRPPSRLGPIGEPSSGQRRVTHRRGARRSFRVWWFIVPGLAIYLFVIVVPAIQGAFYGFTSWDGLSGAIKYVGFANFKKILHDPVALGAIRQTLYLTVAVTVGVTIIGLLMALGVKSMIKSRKAIRVVLFAPAVVAPVMTAFLWQYILSPYGALNSLLADVGMSRFEENWLGSPRLALWSVSGVMIWQFSGYAMVIFLAGLEGIDASVTEAADVDGASALKKFRYVILPLLVPAAIINIMLFSIMGLKEFDTVWIMTQGGPGNATQTLATVIYQDAFNLSEFGYAIAVALFLSVLVMVVSSVLYRSMIRRSRPL
jgi:raffinose/stachyose/melibiose transport system permease protein